MYSKIAYQFVFKAIQNYTSSNNYYKYQFGPQIHVNNTYRSKL